MEEGRGNGWKARNTVIVEDAAIVSCKVQSPELSKMVDMADSEEPIAG